MSALDDTPTRETKAHSLRSEVVGEPLTLGSSVRAWGEQAPGATIGRYLVIGEVGRGGMGVVLRAYDPKLQREVALKCLRPELLPSLLHARMVREARAMAKLNHRNVVAVYDVEVEDDRVVLVMEYVEGPTLKAWLRAEPRPWQAVVRTFVGAGRGVQASHDAGLLHRDFKPDNVLLAPGGEPKVTDFGIAQRRSPDGENRPSHAGPTEPVVVSMELTAADRVVGTLPYMAPEQHVGDELGPAADQYAFCVSLWQGLTTLPPFGSSGSAYAIAQLKLRGAPPWPKTASTVPRHVVEAIRRGLAPEPAARWPSMEALLAELERDPTRRRRRMLALAAVASVAVGGLGWRTYDRTRTAAACEAEGRAIEAVWSEPVAAQVVAAFADAAAVDTWARAEPKVRAFVDAWGSLRTQTCLDEQLHHTRTAALTSRARACLDEQLAHLRGLAAQWSTPDVAVVNSAVAAAWQLPPPDRCIDEEELARRDDGPGDPAMAAAAQELRERLAETVALADSGHYAQALAVAEPVLEEAVALDHPGTIAAARLRVGQLQFDMARYEDALRSLEATFGAAEVQGDDSLALAAANTLISVATRRMQHAEASRWFWLAELKRDRLGLGPEHPRFADALNNLGVALEAEGRYDEALAADRRALAIREATLGPDHPRVASVLNNIGVVLGAQGHVDEALATHERALAIWEAALGPEHPNVAMSITNLGITRHRQGEFAEAIEHYRRALAIQQRVLGPDHPELAILYNNLGGAYLLLNRPDEAVPELDRALALAEQAVGPDHVQVGQALLNLGEAHQLQHRDVEAYEEQARALAIFERSLPSEHPLVMEGLLAVGEAHEVLGRAAEAVPLLERGLEVAARTGVAAAQQAPHRFVLARARWSLGQHERARELAARSLADLPTSAGLRADVQAWLAAHTTGSMRGAE